MGSGRTEASSAVPPEFGCRTSTLVSGNGGHRRPLLHGGSGAELGRHFSGWKQGLAPSVPSLALLRSGYSSSASLVAGPACTGHAGFIIRNGPLSVKRSAGKSGLPLVFPPLGEVLLIEDVQPFEQQVLFQNNLPPAQGDHKLSHAAGGHHSGA